MRITLHLEHVASPIGTMLLAADDEGTLRALDFADYESRMQRLLGRHYGTTYELRPGRVPASVTAALADYFDGALTALDAVAVRTNGSAFQQRVWAALRDIPAGATTSYGRLASTLGQASASRAVGLANGANPIGIVVPCHRVIGANGKLTGYGGGLERKRWLLDHEARFQTAAVPARASA